MLCTISFVRPSLGIIATSSDDGAWSRTLPVNLVIAGILHVVVRNAFKRCAVNIPWATPAVILLQNFLDSRVALGRGCRLDGPTGCILLLTGPAAAVSQFDTS
jgi:hypothetical protein